MTHLIKKSTAILLSFAFTFSLPTSYAQKKQDVQFEKCKGKLPFPVCTLYKPGSIVSRKNSQVRPGNMNVVFITDSAAEVRAVHAGNVAKIFTVEDGYAIVTHFGDYYITYYPVTNPSVKKGDPVYCGQPLSRVSSTGSVPQLNLLLSKSTTFIDPYKWFSW